MTALMAFFLVMWLVNTSPKDKVTGVANYFNPFRANSPAPFTPGVRDPARHGGGNESSLPPGPKLTGAKTDDTEEASLFRDPFPALAQLASRVNAVIARPRGAES